MLAGIGGGALLAVGGCLGSVSGPASEESGPLTLSVVSVDSASDPLSYGVTVSNDRLAAAGTPVLDIAAENTGTETVRWSYTGQVGDLPFPQGVRDAGTGGLVIGLKPEVEAQLAETTDGCSRVEEFVTADGIKNTVLAPGERIERSYAVAGVAAGLEGGCPDPGEYRMEHEPGSYGTWGFEFRLE